MYARKQLKRFEYFDVLLWKVIKVHSAVVEFIFIVQKRNIKSDFNVKRVQKTSRFFKRCREQTDLLCGRTIIHKFKLLLLWPSIIEVCSLGAYISALIALIASSVSIEAKTVFIMRPLVVSADIANWIISCDKCVAPCLNEKLTHTHLHRMSISFYVYFLTQRQYTGRFIYMR